MTRASADAGTNPRGESDARTNAHAPSASDPPQPRMIDRPCPLCGADRHDPHLEAPDTTFGFPGTFRVVRCRGCDMLYTRPQIAPECIGAYFPAEYSAHAAERAQRHATSRTGHDPWDRIKPFGERRLLDVGCGSGAFLLRQRARGWRVAGIEPSREAAERARSLGLDDVWATDIAGAAIDGRQFEVITLLGVLDHIPEPLSALERLKSVCAEGGRLMVSVPNAAGAAAERFGASWPGWDLPRHQNHFAPDTLRAMLSKAGFARVELSWKRRTSHWRRGAQVHAAATGSRFWRIAAASRNLCGLLSRLHARGERCDELVAVAVSD